MYKEFVDKRGIFRELIKKSDCFDIRQISLNVVNDGCEKGGHYHKLTNEAFIVLDGEMNVSLKNLSISSATNVILLKKYDFIKIDPFTKHTVYSENGCTFLVLSDKEFDPNNTDTYRKFDDEE